jgi:2-oxoglutarate dehydrogenase E2 component (dihydrolipoamide succinyltransferase)
VRRIARESGVDPDTVSGSGKAGRVTKADMLEATQATEAAPPPEVAEVPESPAPSVEGAVVRKKMTPLRKTIARRLVEAQQTTAMLTTFNEVDMSAVMQLRKRHQEAFIEKHGVKLGFMSFFTKAVVQALQAVPSVKGQIDGDEILTFSQDDIGIAVSTPKGLMVPVVRNCREKSFAEVEKEILYFAGKAREGKITMDDLSGGVFTITNGGIFGSMLSTPILNSPQSAILGMHTIQQRPVAIDGEVVIRPMMYLALSYDHRLVDGREAVTFLVTVKRAIEDPSSLLFDL